MNNKDSSPATNFQKTVVSKRIISLDALRGFNMFWIIGAEEIADALSGLKILGAHLISTQLNHATWNGFTFYDLIYPMFIYVVGVSIALAIERRRKRGNSPGKILRHIFSRTILLYLVGLYLSNSGLNLHGWLTNLRWMGVLQRIALCYLGVSFLVLFIKTRYQVMAAGVILVGYWLLLRFAPVPGYGAGVWNIPEASFANYFDKLFLPGRLYYHTWDPEGLLSTFPAVVTCLLGAFTWGWLGKTNFNGTPLSREKKVFWLAMAGLVLASAGVLWGIVFPINKKIWTSSYTLVTGGLSAIFQAFFYWIIDIKGFQKWAFPFVIIGLNSFFIYIFSNLVPLDSIARWLIGASLLHWLGAARELTIAILSLGISFLLLYLMYRRKIFLRL